MGCEGSKVEYARGPAPTPAPAVAAQRCTSPAPSHATGVSSEVAMCDAAAQAAAAEVESSHDASSNSSSARRRMSRLGSIAEGIDAPFKPVPGVRGLLALHAFPSRRAVWQLQKDGCDVVVTLQKDAEGAPRVQKLCRAAGIRWIQIDFWKLLHGGDVEGLAAAVRQVARLLQSGRRVVLHCAAGIHRTGMMAYAVLRAVGMTPQEAIPSLHALRETTWRRVGAHRIYNTEIFLAQHLPAYPQPLTAADFPPETDKPLPPVADIPIRHDASFTNCDAISLEAASELEACA